MECWCQSTRTPKTWVFQGHCFHHHFQCECSARQHFLNSPWWIAGFEVPLLGQLNFESGWQWGYWLATWTLIGCDSSTFAGVFIIVWWLNCRIQWFNLFHAMNGGPFLSPIFCLFCRQNQIFLIADPMIPIWICIGKDKSIKLVCLRCDIFCIPMIINYHEQQWNQWSHLMFYSEIDPRFIPIIWSFPMIVGSIHPHLIGLV
jgi:hypothetical protein